MDERRRFSRILFAATAHLIQGDNKWETTILDLSLNGALVSKPEGFVTPQNTLTLSFLLPDSEIELRMDAELVHNQDQQLGLRCLNIDVDSISHLRRMIELNLGDTALLNREFTLFIESHNANKD